MITTTLRIYDPAAKRAALRVDRREYPQDFYVLRGLAKLMTEIGELEAARAILVRAKQAKGAA